VWVVCVCGVCVWCVCVSEIWWLDIAASVVAILQAGKPRFRFPARREFSPLQNIKRCFRAHPTSYSGGTACSFPGGKSTGSEGVNSVPYVDQQYV